MGTDPYALLAELLGRETGINGGRSGSMNMVDPDHGVLGCYGIVGGSIAAATGAALSLRGCWKAAIRDENPLLFLEHKRLYGLKGEVEGGGIVTSALPRLSGKGAT